MGVIWYFEIISWAVATGESDQVEREREGLRNFSFLWTFKITINLSAGAPSIDRGLGTLGRTDDAVCHHLLLIINLEIF